MTSTDTADQPPQQPPVGIDLGTTYSVVAFLDATGRPTTVPNSSGELITPSAILVDEEDIVVGREAVKGSAVEPASYAECFKRDMGGTSFHSTVHGMEIPPEVLSGLVLERLKQDAERQLGPIREVVITVPAFFDEIRRRATQDAGRLAGLKVLDIINEPTAAAVAFGYNRGFLNLGQTDTSAGPRRVLVYDLGGGTFDVTILEIEGTRFHALATDGDVRLGGKDFDERLVNYLADRFVAEHGADPRSDPQDAAQLWLDAQEAKHALSERSKTTVVCFHAGIRMRIEVTREVFGDLTRDLLQRTETTTSLVVRQAGLEWSDIDRVLLVGGSSRMPMVAAMLEGLTGKEPDRSQSPDEVVAHGAALYAGMLMGSENAAGTSEFQLVNVNSHSLGVVGFNQRTRRYTNVVLIPKNSRLPCQAVRSFKTARADQRSVKVPVVEGESHRPEDCIALGECVVRNLPPGLPQGTRIEVEYRYAANGRISVHARVPSVRHSAQVEIERDRVRDLGDLETWRARLHGLCDASAPEFGTAAAARPVDLSDRAGVLRRLDALYITLGKAAAATDVPESLRRNQQMAAAATTELESASRNVQQAEADRQAAGGSAEAIQAAARLSQAKESLKQLQTRADFAHLVLGRECANQAVALAGTEATAAEIGRLRAHLAK